MAPNPLMAALGKKLPAMGEAEESAEGDTSADTPAEEVSEAGSEMKFAQLASEATAAGDHEAAAKAMVSAIKACMNQS